MALLASLLPWHSYLEGWPLLALSLSEVSGPLHVLAGSLPVVIWPVSVVCPAGWTLCTRQLRVPRDGKLCGPRNECHFHRVLLVKEVTRPLKGREFRHLLSEGEVHRICDPSLICHMQEKCGQPPRGALLHTVTQRPRLKGALPFSACLFQACPGVGIQLADAGREEASVPTGWSVSQPWTWHVSLPHMFRGRNSAHGLTRLQGRLGNVSGREKRETGSASPPVSLSRCMERVAGSPSAACAALLHSSECIWMRLGRYHTSHHFMVCLDVADLPTPPASSRGSISLCMDSHGCPSCVSHGSHLGHS